MNVLLIQPLRIIAAVGRRKRTQNRCGLHYREGSGRERGKGDVAVSRQRAAFQFPSKRRSSLPVAKSQSRALPSQLPENARLESGEKATLITAP